MMVPCKHVYLANRASQLHTHLRQFPPHCNRSMVVLSAVVVEVAVTGATAAVAVGGGGNGIAGTSNVNGRPRPSCRGNRIWPIALAAAAVEAAGTADAGACCACAVGSDLGSTF